ncbi:integration host factor subunit alpha [Candidatus Liberibacter americanus]|uniref:Integration host factor subunit alpha n=1 Tax=Candidatus Liberibacter americanus str. Sao Paulo TaxID=1261131 RepID=U6B3Z7_9HYPH|nr:integration host factor subunit alpha [Candidatus Liberibacter americanus]AHA27779.1 Bacterial nucleoid DNA-binding protein [Candidatus Liberibacter americanus str. Sao Paulo]EMS36164.1 integration host factor subunit alpha [Candidatus Liberibacter americanus PW_SP]
MNKALTRADLVKSISKKFDITMKDSSSFVNMVFDEICDSAIRGEKVKISSFATFNVRDKKARIGRDPKSGQSFEITPRRVITFKASNVLKKKIMDAFDKDKLRE